jgi:CheY-like chemotaxis protein
MSKILVIEDEPDSALLIRSILQSAGYAVKLTASRDDGIKALLNESFDCIVLDYYMPGKTVFQFMRFLSARDEHVPVVLCTCANSPEDLARLLSIDQCLKKPFAPDALIAAVEAACPRGGQM